MGALGQAIDPTRVLELAPEVRIHPDEPFRPWDPDEFLDHFDVQHVRRSLFDLGPVTARIPIGTARALADREVSAGAVEGRLIARVPRRRVRADLGHPTRPMPALYEETELADGTIAVTFWLFFSRSDAFARVRIGGVELSRLLNGVSVHDGDWERFVVVMAPDRSTPAHAAFFRHSGLRVLSWADLELSDGHPVVYVARGSHAAYPHSRKGWGVRDVCAFDAKRCPALCLWKRPLARCELQAWYRLGVRWGRHTSPVRGRVAGSPYGPGNRVACPPEWLVDSWPGLD